MKNMLSEDITFEGFDSKKDILAIGEYENCLFKNCKLNSVDLSNFTFNECVFEGCDMSLAVLKNTVLNDVKFIECKLLGVNFDDCNSLILSVCFESCFLKLSVFYRLKLKKTIFSSCNLQEVDFTETDLTNSTFENCDLQSAIFNYTNLEKVDFYSSNNYSIDPEINKIKKAKFSKMGVIGLLDKYSIDIQ